MVADRRRLVGKHAHAGGRLRQEASAALRPRRVATQINALVKRLSWSAALLALSPWTASAQPTGPQSTPGFYVGLESGLNWLLDNNSFTYSTGYAVGGVAGYDFLGPRLEFEVMYRSNAGIGVVASPAGFTTATGQVDQLSTMVNALYDFRPGATVTPYAGAGIGIAFIDPSIAAVCSLCDTRFAYQGMVGVGYNASSALRVNLEARYYATTSPSTYTNNDFSLLLGATYKFGKP
jgi:OmpA-OmpF porin, OOP family